MPMMMMMMMMMGDAMDLFAGGCGGVVHGRGRGGKVVSAIDGEHRHGEDEV